jgi:DNA-directed RNA polymerase subunit K/omega
MTSKYERVALLAARTAQLEKGAPPAIPVPNPCATTAEQVAAEEIRLGVCPLRIRREYANGRLVYLDHNSNSHVFSTSHST